MTRRKNRKSWQSKPKARRKIALNPKRIAREQIPITSRDKLAGKWFEKLVALQARLYGPGGCPWDREQTHESLRKFLIEETYETLDAMESGDPRKFAGELGDLLLQVIFHSILAEKAGQFTISDVIESIHSKMVRRHPHVFGDVRAKNSAAVLKNWEQIKAEERAAERAASTQIGAPNAPTGTADRKNGQSILDGVPRSLPSLLEAYQLTRRASHVGFDWDNVEAILEKLGEEISEFRKALLTRALSAPARKPKVSRELEEEAGDLFFTVVNIARFMGIDPEIALRKANKKFKRRFEFMEATATREGTRFADLPRARMEDLWNESKGSS